MLQEFDSPRYREEYRVVQRSWQDEWSTITGNEIAVRRIDLTNVQVISCVMGQTVALEFYESQVDGILEEFQEINTAVERYEADRASHCHSTVCLTTMLCAFGFPGMA